MACVLGVVLDRPVVAALGFVRNVVLRCLGVVRHGDRAARAAVVEGAALLSLEAARVAEVDGVVLAVGVAVPLLRVGQVEDTNLPLAVVLHRLNPVLRGWTAYFRHGVSSATFQYLSAFTWRQVFGWLRRKHRRTNWKTLRRRYCAGRWWPADGEVVLFKAAKMRTNRYLYRGAKIPSPWTCGTTIEAVA
ncbi:group II intron maturase-specific domain-containing protein [Kitasatospora sp. NPDC101235]|uniref:group II intron maturase-specific domain-containing protein n=1 Tax=Kitasatospora sp. NPDC101235 TaxID=3364101 RepID=UPI003830242D